MKRVSAAKIASQFNDYLDASQRQPVLVTRNGKPVAVLVAVADAAQAEEMARPGRRSLRSLFEEAHAQLEQGKGVSQDEFWKQVRLMRRAETRKSKQRERKK